jgi:hypothetical protein
LTTTEVQFLREGASSYIEALAAIKAFEKAVCVACRDVYDKYKPQLLSQVGLKDGPCEDYTDNREPENRFAELGVRQDSPSGRETLDIFLMWEDSKDGVSTVSACISLGFTTKAERNDMQKLLRSIPSIKSGDLPWPYLWSSKELTDLSSCVETLGELLNEWLACWPIERKLK